MELIHNIRNIKSYHKECAITIGNFDGFHLGHKALIEKLKIEGHNMGLPVIAIIFEPQPKEYFLKKKAPARLTWFRDKIKYLSTTGINSVLCIRFNKNFASLSASYFIKELLINKLNIRFIYIGDDFHFGARRTGNLDLLHKFSYNNNFKVIKIVPYIKNGRRISSTIIRKALIKDQLFKAEMLLGHTYKISGRIIQGKKMGRIIGFPTANILLPKGQNFPIHGVYAVKVYGIFNTPLLGIANIGTCPTFLGLKSSIEVHLIDIDINVYGYYIEVVICSKIRKEQCFPSIISLKKQIKKDIINVKKYFKLIQKT